MKIKNSLKIAFFAIAMLGFSTAKAQTNAALTDPGKGKNSPNTTQANKAGEVVRLVDNKGTIKYLQSNNGITTITSTAANNKTTTTWQLGGTLVEDTNINTDGKKFKISGLTSDAREATTTNGTTTTNWKVSIIDEETKELKTTDVKNLIKSGLKTASIKDFIKGGQAVYQGNTDATTDASKIVISTAKTISGLPAVLFKVNVFRNGSKLEAGKDYTVTEGKLTLVDMSDPKKSPNDWKLYDGDKIEVVWIN